jgi:hypothetical protein
VEKDCQVKIENAFQFQLPQAFANLSFRLRERSLA